MSFMGSSRQCGNRLIYSEPALSVKIDRMRAEMFSARISSLASALFDRLRTLNELTAMTVPSSTEAASTVTLAERLALVVALFAST
jgi:hypothetical protein